MKISVVGLGYVGSTICGCFSKEGHEVIGVDVNEFKVSCIKSGRSPVTEPELDVLICDGVNHGRLTATLNLKEALALSDMTMICVGTPVHKDGNIDTTFITRVTQEIAEVLTVLGKKHILVYRSTILPGMMDKVIYPLLFYKNNLSPDKVHITYNPEFLREGSAIFDFYYPAKTVIGIYDGDNEIGQILLQLYSFVDGEKFVTDISSAQMVKYADNIFHALKITFANEIGLACRSLGIDSHEVMDIFCKDNKLNLSRAYLIPGKPYGGSCLTKDIRAFCSKIKDFDFPAALINSIEDSNFNQIKYIATWIRSFGKRKIGFIGLTFKPDTDDLRNSPAVEIAKMLYSGKYGVSVYDPNLYPDKLIGANFEFLYSELPDIGEMLFTNLHDFSDRCELFVIFNKYSGLDEWLIQLSPDKIVLDLVRIGNHHNNKPNYYGLYW